MSKVFATPLLAEAFQKSTPATQRDIVKNLKGARDMLYRNRRGKERALEAMAVTDHFVDLVDKTGIACKEGCGGCCHKKVDISESEAQLIVDYLIREKAAFSLKRMQGQVAHDKMSDADYWKLPKDERRCPFLGDGEKCTIYPVRPVACRKYMVMDSAEPCSDPNVGVQIKVAYSANAEIMASALIALEKNTHGILAKKVLDEIQRIAADPNAL